MMIRFAILPLVLALNFSMCKKQQAVTDKQQPAGSAAPAAANATAAPVVAATPKIKKPVVDQTAQTLIFCYHRLVDKIRYPGTEITPAAFEAEMKELKDKGITVISMQDLLAWKRGEKNIPPRCAVITCDNGVDIQAHTATHQDLREGHNVTVIEPGGKRSRKKLTGADYEKWVQNEVVGAKELLEKRLGIKVNCFAVPFGNYNEHVKELARNAGYEAMFTVYGQPITFTSPMDAIGRYAIEANKPKVFGDAVSMIGASSGGGTAVAEVGAKDLTTHPADGETVRTALPLIIANPRSEGFPVAAARLESAPYSCFLNLATSFRRFSKTSVDKALSASQTS